MEVLLKAHDNPGSFLQIPAAAELASLGPPLPDDPSTVIGPYTLLQPIGEGGMGVVYLAEQQQPIQRRVALKVIKPGMDTTAVIARFEAERHVREAMDSFQRLSGVYPVNVHVPLHQGQWHHDLAEILTAMGRLEEDLRQGGVLARCARMDLPWALLPLSLRDEGV